MIEIPFTELTDNVNEFLNSISKVFFHQKGDEESQLDRNRIEYSKICSITGEYFCSFFDLPTQKNALFKHGNADNFFKFIPFLFQDSVATSTRLGST